MFDIARIADFGLAARIDYHESLGSTSDRAVELGLSGETALPLLVLAERQTAGRGRGTNRWLTSRGALTFSLLLDAPPDCLPAERWPQVSLAAGLAVCEALQTQIVRGTLRVKWPNDVYLAGRKVAGILSESIPGLRDRLVVGIGANINNEFNVTASAASSSVDAPELVRTAISMIEHDGIVRDLTDVLISILDQFDRRWHDLLAGAFDRVAAAYREKCFLTSRTVTIEQPGGVLLAGVCSGIDDTGALRLRTEAGQRTVVSGSVSAWDE